MDQYRVAFIGCGRRADLHAPGVKADDRCKAVAFADVKENAAAEFRDRHGFTGSVYEDYRELLIEEKPDVVVSCLWTALHLPVFCACADAGVKAVLSEKPMSGNWGECLEMDGLARSSGCQLTFSHQRRFSPGNIFVREIIDSGLLGPLLRMDLYSPQHLLDCGTHTFDQALSFNAESPAKWALGAVDSENPLSYFNVQSERLATGLVVFENGVRAYIQAGGPDMDIWGGVRVIGSKGFIEVIWDGEIKNAVIYDDPTWTAPVFERDEPTQMIGLIRDTIDGLALGIEPQSSHKKALRAAEIIFGLYESVRRHRKTIFPLAPFEDNPFITMLHAGEFERALIR